MIKILIYNKGYKAQGFFLDFNGLYEMDTVENLINLFIDNLEVVLQKQSYESYKKLRLEKYEFPEQISQSRQKEFYSIAESTIIKKDFATFEFKIKII